MSDLDVFYPLDSPGMPLPGQLFQQWAEGLGGEPCKFSKGPVKTRKLLSHSKQLENLYIRALYDPDFYVSIPVRGGEHVSAPWVHGRVLGSQEIGPQPASTMVISRQPTDEDALHKCPLSGEAGDVFVEALRQLGAEHELSSWYYDYLVHWPAVDPSKSTLPAAHIKDNAIVLQQTLRLVRPNYILCVGSEAAKTLLGSSYTVSSMVGQVVDYRFPIHKTGEEPVFHTAKVMVISSPGAVLRVPEAFPEFVAQLGQFVQLTHGVPVGAPEKDLCHPVVYCEEELADIIDEILGDPDPQRRIIAVDAEWEGDFPADPEAYLRTIQFSTKEKEGVCVVLRHQGGAPAFYPNPEAAIRQLRRLLLPDPDRGYYPRIGGHFFRADLPWLIHEGLDLRDGYAAADTPEECRTKGGWDTGLMHHAVNETASYRLTHLTVRLTEAPAYDRRLDTYVSDYCKEQGISKKHLTGYGFLPAWILHPTPLDPEWPDNYAQYDADVCRRIAIEHMKPGGLLDGDINGNSCWEPYWRSHRASLGVLEMEMTGLPIDKDQVDKLTMNFVVAYNTLLQEFRRRIRWPAFNPQSPDHCVAFLFGEQYLRGKKPAPEGAVTLGLTPIKTTGRRSKLWEKVVAQGVEARYSPSTDKEVLGILGQHEPLVKMLRDIKFLGQALKGTLRRPETDIEGNILRDDDGNLVYSAGYASLARSDGRVHTTISQVKETGRAGSSRPNLQNVSKKREDDYKRIMGYRDDDGTPKGDYVDIIQEPLYTQPVRTIFRAPPGHVFVEADYTGAELAVLAWLSGDPTMIEHVRRNALPEDHPDHYDMHSQRAVSTFQLSCPPTKKGLKEAGCAGLRVAAKNVMFGIPYGRSAEAISRQCAEEGVDVTVEQCQSMIDAYFREYPYVAVFLEECRRRSQEERWLAGSFGRFRRFVTSHSAAVVGEQQRQAQNFPIQNTVADAIWMAVYNFHKFKKDNPQWKFQLAMQIHDALLFIVPYDELDQFVNHVLPENMVRKVPVYPRRLDNTPMDVKEPYFFGYDVSISEQWGLEDVDLQTQQKGMQACI